MITTLKILLTPFAIIQGIILGIVEELSNLWDRDKIPFSDKYFR